VRPAAHWGTGRKWFRPAPYPSLLVHPSFTDRWHSHEMYKGCFNAATAAVIASLLDRHFCDNRHIDAALVILRQIGRGLGF
jgi:hypothetical protein